MNPYGHFVNSNYHLNGAIEHICSICGPVDSPVCTGQDFIRDNTQQYDVARSIINDRGEFKKQTLLGQLDYEEQINLQKKQYEVEGPDTNKYVYLAGGMTGLKFEVAEKWRMEVKKWLLSNIKTISPLRDYHNLRNKTLETFGGGRPLNSPKAIYNRDFDDIRRSNAILFNFIGAEKVSIGSCVELGACLALNKPAVIVIDKDNIHDHPLTTTAAGYVADSLPAGCWMINSILRTGN